MASRLPGAIAMSLLVLLAAWWAYQHFNSYPRADGIDISPEGFALLSGLILATSPQLVNLARSGVNDSIFALFCFAAVYCLGQSFESRRSFFAGRPWRQWVLFAYVLIGLGMLTKGPAAFLFVLIPYMAMCWT
jgi:4-amino-4-deoxy-L-arabinose transferase-like glycosyltransferase